MGRTPVKIAQILTYASFLRSKKATFAQSSGVERGENSLKIHSKVEILRKCAENALERV